MPEDNQSPSPQPDHPQSSAPSPNVIQSANSNVVSPHSSASQPLVSPGIAQPAAIINGQPFQPTTPISSSQYEQISDQKPPKWRYFFIILGILQAIGVGIFFLVITWAIQQAKAGVSGTEFTGLIVNVTLVPAVGLVAFVNLIGLPMYMLRHKPHGKGLALSVLSLSISVMLVIYGAYSVYQFRVAIPKHVEQLSRQTEQKIQAKQQQFSADNAKPEITKDDAIALLNACQLKGLYYTNQTSPKEDGNWAESSTTGVVLTKIDGQPYRISIADRLVPELVPIARQAQEACGGQPQFWHDGHYE